MRPHHLITQSPILGFTDTVSFSIRLTTEGGKFHLPEKELRYLRLEITFDYGLYLHRSRDVRRLVSEDFVNENSH